MICDIFGFTAKHVTFFHIIFFYWEICHASSVRGILGVSGDVLALSSSSPTRRLPSNWACTSILIFPYLRVKVSGERRSIEYSVFLDMCVF